LGKNFDPDRGEVRAPLVLWGPYLGLAARTALTRSSRPLPRVAMEDR